MKNISHVPSIASDPAEDKRRASYARLRVLLSTDRKWKTAEREEYLLLLETLGHDVEWGLNFSGILGLAMRPPKWVENLRNSVRELDECRVLLIEALGQEATKGRMTADALEAEKRKLIAHGDALHKELADAEAYLIDRARLLNDWALPLGLTTGDHHAGL
jgi:hypothetical protein